MATLCEPGSPSIIPAPALPKDEPPRLVFVRHGKPVIDANIQSKQWVLSQTGWDASKALAQQLKTAGLSLQRIISSSESKALATAEAIRLELQLDPLVEIDSDIVEHKRSRGGLLPQEEFENSMNRFFNDDPDRLVFGEETASDALARFKGAVNRALDTATASSPEGRDIMLVTHGTVLTLYVAQTLGVDPLPFWRELKMPVAVVISGDRMEIIEPVKAKSRLDVYGDEEGATLPEGSFVRDPPVLER